MKDTKTIKAIGIVVYTLLLFAILFDPTELAVGSELVTLPGIALVIAQGIGNIAWIAGILYMWLFAVATWILFDNDLMKKTLTDSVKNGSISNYKMSWAKWPMFVFGLVSSLIALGSGFWFTGFFWLAALLVSHAMSTKVRKSPEFKEFEKVAE